MISFIKDPTTRADILRALHEGHRVAGSSIAISPKLDPGTLKMLLQQELFDQMGFITSIGDMFGAVDPNLAVRYPCLQWRPSSTANISPLQQCLLQFLPNHSTIPFFAILWLT